MKTLTTAIVLILFAISTYGDRPATGPSGTVCESEGGSCKGLRSGILIPYKNKCNKYIQCIDGCGCDMQCSSGLHFNSRLQTCDWPNKAGCDSSITNSTLGPSEIVCESLGELCKNIQDGTLIGYKNDCTQYIQCSKGCEYHKKCSFGTHFSQSLGGCTWPSEAKCDPFYEDLQPITNPTPYSSSVAASSNPTFVPSKKTTPVPRPTSAPVLTSTEKFGTVTESATTRTPRPTPTINSSPSKTPTSSWKTTTSRNPTPSKSTPTPIIPGISQNSCSAEEPGKLLPFVGNCSKFIACGDKFAYEIDCGPYLHFDALVEICDWPENAGCDPSFVKTSQILSCQSAGASCIAEVNGKLLPYTGNCERFVVCEKGCGFNMSCANGLHFNKALGICDRPEEAGCDSKIETND